MPAHARTSPQPGGPASGSLRRRSPREDLARRFSEVYGDCRFEQIAEEGDEDAAWPSEASFWQVQADCEHDDRHSGASKRRIG